ncbi:ABC transporter permease [Catellatospora sp. KI3]|uniref:ABC transporter permease n=1 Tax=Catellatospora sp. KI3 TaxID=3041620 RepID=UPI002482342F|nr:ABC transporter permease [Catellatospora sp. KI3]MDI1463484.1 ABC transporter permease [Catellatospora sp. KI3]
MNLSMLATAVAVEGRKAAASRVLTSSAILLIVGVAALAAATTAAAGSGNEQLAAKLGPLAATGGWPAVLNVATQVTAAAGLLAYGVGLSWMFGREFTDGTVTGLFGLPVTRPALALAKLVVFLLWGAATAVALTLAVGLVGFAVTGQLPQPGDVAGLGRLLALAVMTAALAVPAAWAATLGRGLLPAIATIVGLMAVTQIVVVAGAGGGWFPPAAPALWALLPATVGGAELLFAAFFPLLFGGLTLHAWHRLQLDR